MKTDLIKFETHLTFRPTTENNTQGFIEFCSQSGGKALLIELPQGEFPRQLMMSKIFFSNNLENVFSRIRKYTENFQVKGFQVNRVKIEVDSEFSTHFEKTNKETYFEWHGKIELENIKTISQICSKHNAHMSKNSLKNETSLRYITLREFEEKNKFEIRVKRLVNELVQAEFKIIKEQFEFCVFDSNLKLDNGWLNNELK